MELVDEPRIYPITVPVEGMLKSINFYLVQDGEAIYLLDAGQNNEACWQALNHTLQEHGFMLEDITCILLTHHHSDHVGLVDRIVSTHPIPVYAHPLAIPRLKRDEQFLHLRIQFFANLYAELGCGEAGEQQVEYLKRAVIRNKGQRVQSPLYELSGESWQNFKLIHLPGHCPDQIGFYLPEWKILFAGDMLINHISSNALVEPNSEGKKIPSLLEHVASYEKCLSLDLDLVYSGHGLPITNPYELIKRRLSGIDRKANRFLEIISSGVSTASDLAQAYYKETYKEQFALVMSEVIGHLDYLEARGKVYKDRREGVWHYFI